MLLFLRFRQVKNVLSVISLNLWNITHYYIQERTGIKFVSPALIDTGKFWNKEGEITHALREITSVLFVIGLKKKWLVGI